MVRLVFRMPSCFSISAIRAFTEDEGIETFSWYAELALRRRASMSAIGSVIVITLASGLSRNGFRFLADLLRS